MHGLEIAWRHDHSAAYKQPGCPGCRVMRAGGHLLLNAVQRQLDDREDRARAGGPLGHAPDERARALHALRRRRAVAVPPGLRDGRLSPERRAQRLRSRVRQRRGAAGGTGVSRPWPTSAAQPGEARPSALAPGEPCSLRRAGKAWLPSLTTGATIFNIELRLTRVTLLFLPTSQGRSPPGSPQSPAHTTAGSPARSPPRPAAPGRPGRRPRPRPRRRRDPFPCLPARRRARAAPRAPPPAARAPPAPPRTRRASPAWPRLGARAAGTLMTGSQSRVVREALSERQR
jgi:hypothetical protein